MDILETFEIVHAADAPTPAYVCTCPHCGYQPTESRPFGGFMRDDLVFTVCPLCGSDWPD